MIFHSIPRSKKVLPFISALFLILPLTANATVQQGRVNSAGKPIVGATVKLYQAGISFQDSAIMLGSAITSPGGSFKIQYTPPNNDDAVLYLIAAGGSVHKRPTLYNDSIRLATVLGSKSIPNKADINERTTVGVAYTMAQFLNGDTITGPLPGVPNAADILRNLVNLKSGAIGHVLATKPNGSETETLPTFNSLANMLAVCINDQAQCASLFALATPPSGDAIPIPPVNTLQAILNIALYPYQNATNLFVYSNGNKVYKKTLSSAPDAWTLALRYNGNGKEMDGPGFIAFDTQGSAWIANNYNWKKGTKDPQGTVCGAQNVLRLTPTGDDIQGPPPAPYTGGGANGAGFGILIDKNNDVWNGNFGFAGKNCADKDEVLTLSHSVSLYSSDGNAISPDNEPELPGGYSGDGSIYGPQGMSSNPMNGDIWISNCRNNTQEGNTVTLLRAGNPADVATFTPFDLSVEQHAPDFLPKPFGMTVDINNVAWVAGNNINQVVGIDADGNQIAIFGNEKQYDETDAGKHERPVFRPMGIASDSLGGVWVANSGFVDIACGYRTNDNSDIEGEDSTFNSMQGAGVLDERGKDDDSFTGPFASIALIKKDENGIYGLTKFKGGGAIAPWGIAADGDDNIWVANFDGQRLSQFCGSNTATCPPGKQKEGMPISPETGYSFSGLVRNTGVSIDPSGNVWLTNNWLEDPIQTNPGGREVVVFLGLAKPVMTPLLGYPRPAE